MMGRAGPRAAIVMPRAAIALFVVLAAGCGGTRPASRGAAAPRTTASTVADAAGGALVAGTRFLDGFEDPGAWKGIPADGVTLALSGDQGATGRALRLDIAFSGGGYAVVHRDIALDLPDNYAFSFRIRGEIPPNHVEFKLIDATGENVWWSVRRDVGFDGAWQTFTVRKRQVSFAWGPSGGGEIRHVAAIEFAITAGSGGRGTVWLDDLTLRPLAPAGTQRPAMVTASSDAGPGYEAARALDGDAGTAWQPARTDRSPWLQLDFGESREVGGVSTRWPRGDVGTRLMRDWSVEGSDDGQIWRPLGSVTNGARGFDHLPFTDVESRYLRLRTAQPLAEVVVRPPEFAESRNAFFQTIAAESPRGSYPRGLSGEQVYWTVVGADSDAADALLSEDGAIETRRGGFSIEPFVRLHIRDTGARDTTRLAAGVVAPPGESELIGWSRVTTEQTLADESLPIPTVRWKHDRFELMVTAVPIGESGASSLAVRYSLQNRGAVADTLTLYLALRPFQVNPPSQFLNLTGGTARVVDIRAVQERQGPRRLNVDGRLALEALTPDAFWAGAVAFHDGEIVEDELARDVLWSQEAIRDSTGFGAAAIGYRVPLAPGASRDVYVCLPLEGEAEPVNAGNAAEWFARAERDARRAWSETLNRVVTAPGAPDGMLAALRAQVAWMLVDRAGPALQPGTRSYARSWIRDGALMSTVLLRLGEAEAVAAYLDWFAPYQYPHGKIPCVVDTRGADPTPEHDSSGEFVYLVHEYWRYTKDRARTGRMWPRVLGAVAYLDSLRNERLGDEWRAPDRREFYGILPPSISHEGYSARPMHSYWDDFFALRAFEDAADLSREFGTAEDTERLAAIRDDFARDFAASVEAAMARHGIDYVPGCADLGDFDATSTAIALVATDGEHILPEAAVRNTFERYWTFFEERARGTPWDALTPYEMRSIGAMLRLGHRDRALAMTRYFLDLQRPHGWRAWPEVVWPDARKPGFLGDLPHAWIGSDFARSVLDMFAYERSVGGNHERRELVIAAGVEPSWLDGGEIAVSGLGTAFGSLNYRITREKTGRGRIVLRIEGGLDMPPGGIVVDLPEAWARGRATLNGSPVRASDAGEIRIARLPATLALAPGRGGNPRR